MVDEKVFWLVGELVAELVAYLVLTKAEQRVVYLDI